MIAGFPHFVLYDIAVGVHSVISASRLLCDGRIKMFILKVD